MIKVLGHRGLRRDKKRDENSLPAFAAALDAADGLEADARVSRDGTPFLLHNPGLAQPLDRLSDAEIGRLRLKKGGDVPRLADLFALAGQHPGKTLNIEIKSKAAVAPVISEIRKACAAGKAQRDNILLTSFDPDAVQQARRLEPGIKCGLICHRLNRKTAAGLTPDYIILNARKLKVRDVAWVRQHLPAAKIMVWMPYEPRLPFNLKVRRLLRNKKIKPHLDAIISDYPEQMAKFLKKKGINP